MIAQVCNKLEPPTHGTPEHARGVLLPQPPFIDVVQLGFGIADAARHYPVQLLVNPFSHCTYRGS